MTTRSITGTLVAVTATFGLLVSCGSADPASEDAETTSSIEAESPADEALAAAAQRLEDAEERMDDAEARARAAEQRALDAETRAAEAEARATAAETRVSRLRDRVGNLDEQVESLTAALAAAEGSDPPATASPTPVDPYLIDPGVIADGYHVGYLVSADMTSFSFDMAEILPDGSWKNENPKIRTLPVDPALNGVYGAPPGAPIELLVEQQRVVYVVWL